MTRRSAVALIPGLALLAACASNPQVGSAGPGPEIHIRQDTAGPEMLYFRGPVLLSYVLVVHNPLAVPVVLRRLELRTQGPGAYSLHTDAPHLKRSVPAGGDAALHLAAWGRSGGGVLSATEPVTLVVRAFFDSPQGPLLRVTNQTLLPPS